MKVMVCPRQCWRPSHWVPECSTLPPAVTSSLATLHILTHVTVGQGWGEHMKWKADNSKQHVHRVPHKGETVNQTVERMGLFLLRTLPSQWPDPCENLHLLGTEQQRGREGNLPRAQGKQKQSR